MGNASAWTCVWNTCIHDIWHCIISYHIFYVLAGFVQPVLYLHRAGKLSCLCFPQIPWLWYCVIMFEKCKVNTPFPYWGLPTKITELNSTFITQRTIFPTEENKQTNKLICLKICMPCVQWVAPVLASFKCIKSVWEDWISTVQVKVPSMGSGSVD